MTELTETMKDQIRLEERYRAEIRAQLPPPEGRARETSALTKFINSAFGLWLLSAVFITGAGSFYSQWQTRHAEQQKVRDQIQAERARSKEYQEHLTLEISHRMSQTFIRLWEVSDPKDAHRLALGHVDGEVKTILTDLATGTGPALAPLYPEFIGKSTLVMATDLVTHISSPDSKIADGSGAGQQVAALRRAIEDLSGLTVMMSVERAPLSDPFLIAATLQRRLSALKLLDGGFYFLDCNDEDPFC